MFKTSSTSSSSELEGLEPHNRIGRHRFRCSFPRPSDTASVCYPYFFVPVALPSTKLTFLSFHRNLQSREKCPGFPQFQHSVAIRSILLSCSGTIISRSSSSESLTVVAEANELPPGHFLPNLRRGLFRLWVLAPPVGRWLPCPCEPNMHRRLSRNLLESNPGGR